MAAEVPCATDPYDPAGFASANARRCSALIDGGHRMVAQ
jgi:hypothetical protein